MGAWSVSIVEKIEEYKTVAIVLVTLSIPIGTGIFYLAERSVTSAEKSNRNQVELSEIKSILSTLKTDLTSIDKDVSILKNNFTNISSSIEGNSSEIKKISSNISKTNSAIMFVSSRVSSVENLINQLDSESSDNKPSKVAGLTDNELTKMLSITNVTNITNNNNDIASDPNLSNIGNSSFPKSVIDALNLKGYFKFKIEKGILFVKIPSGGRLSKIVDKLNKTIKDTGFRTDITSVKTANRITDFRKIPANKFLKFPLIFSTTKIATK